MSVVAHPSAIKRSSDAAFTATEQERFARIAETQDWQTAAHDGMRALNHRAYRLAVDEYNAQLRFLLPLTPDSRVLLLHCGWGAVAINLTASVSMVVAIDNRPTMLRFAAARRAQEAATSLQLVHGSGVASLPFTDETFDAVIVLDALEHTFSRSRSGRKGAVHTLLAEARRVLRPAAWLLLGCSNRLGFVRPRGAAAEQPSTYWGYRGALKRAGFTDLQFHAPLPSHHEPFFIVPLSRSDSLSYLVDRMFRAEDYQAKLQARGLGPAAWVAAKLWSVGRYSGLAGLGRYLVPSYLIVGRK